MTLATILARLGIGVAVIRDEGHQLREASERLHAAAGRAARIGADIARGGEPSAHQDQVMRRLDAIDEAFRKGCR